MENSKKDRLILRMQNSERQLVTCSLIYLHFYRYFNKDNKDMHIPG